MVPEGASQPTMRPQPGAEPLSDGDSTGLFSVIVRQPSPAVSVIHIAGEVDLLTGPLLHDHLSALLATRPEHLIIDLSRVSFLGATGLTVLINIRRAAAEQDTTLRLRGTSRYAVARVLEITGLDRLFESLPPATNQRLDPN